MVSNEGGLEKKAGGCGWGVVGCEQMGAALVMIEMMTT